MMILESRTARLTADVVKSARSGGGEMLQRLIPSVTSNQSSISMFLQFKLTRGLFFGGWQKGKVRCDRVDVFISEPT